MTSGANGAPGLAQTHVGTAFQGSRLTCPPRAATSRTLSTFSIFWSTNLPAAADRYVSTLTYKDDNSRH